MALPEAVSLEEMKRSYRSQGLEFGALVFVSCRMFKDQDIAFSAAIDHSEELPWSDIATHGEWLQRHVPSGTVQSFWVTDSGEIFETICEDAKVFAELQGAEINDDLIFNLFQMVFFNFVGLALRHRESKRFIQGSLGHGVLLRMLDRW